MRKDASVSPSPLKSGPARVPIGKPGSKGPQDRTGLGCLQDMTRIGCTVTNTRLASPKGIAVKLRSQPGGQGAAAVHSAGLRRFPAVKEILRLNTRTLKDDNQQSIRMCCRRSGQWQCWQQVLLSKCSQYSTFIALHDRHILVTIEAGRTMSFPAGFSQAGL